MSQVFWLSPQCWIPMVRSTQISLPWAGPSSSLGRAGWWLQGKMYLLQLNPRTPLQAGVLFCALVAPGDQALVGFGGYGEGAAPNPAVSVVIGAVQSLVLHSPHRLCLPLLAPCHNSGSPSPPVQRQGLPSSSALPVSPCACLLLASGGLEKPFSHFSFLCAASPWAHAPAGPPTMLLPPALLCCLMPSCLHLVGPSPAREGSEYKRGGRSPISLWDPSWITLPVGAQSELPIFHMNHAVSIPSGNPLE